MKFLTAVPAQGKGDGSEGPYHSCEIQRKGRIGLSHKGERKRAHRLKASPEKKGHLALAEERSKKSTMREGGREKVLEFLNEEGGRRGEEGLRGLNRKERREEFLSTAKPQGHKRKKF